MSAGELQSVVRAVGGVQNLLDEKHPDAAVFRYLAHDADRLQKLLDEPAMIRTPVVRNGRQATVGYRPDVWETWE